MLSYRLIERIESNWQRLSAAVIEDVQTDERTAYYHGVSDREILERAQKLVRNLGYWLEQRDARQVHEAYEPLGASRAAQGVPLHEVIRKIQLLERRILNFAREQKLDHTALEIHAEAELHYAIDGFFDEVIYALVKGYGEALANRNRRAA